MNNEPEPDWCRSCLQDIRKEADDAISFDGGDSEVCRECWLKMSTFERIILFKLFSDGDNGRGTFADALQTCTAIAEKLFRVKHGHVWYDDCDSCKDHPDLETLRNTLGLKRT